eukprot:2494477-Rhodomonas_salina.2
MPPHRASANTEPAPPSRKLSANPTQDEEVAAVYEVFPPCHFNQCNVKAQKCSSSQVKFVTRPGPGNAFSVLHVLLTAARAFKALYTGEGVVVEPGVEEGAA